MREIIESNNLIILRLTQRFESLIVMGLLENEFRKGFEGD